MIRRLKRASKTRPNKMRYVFATNQGLGKLHVFARRGPRMRLHRGAAPGRMRTYLIAKCPHVPLTKVFILPRAR